ncbi:MAG: hypothetical protein KC800_28265, partial [Candidatus Eremiobacteraeota bacterium]|nr:hypothetical protein [Candidatus Eremiobacteraeota bacterium]
MSKMLCRILLLWLSVGLVWAEPSNASRLKEATDALERGRGDLALPLLTGESVEEEVSRFRAYCELGEYTQARLLLKELEKKSHGEFPPPYDYYFYLNRGLVEEAAENDQLAVKNYAEAFRRAATADQRALARVRTAELWEAREQLGKAKEEFDSLWELVPELQDLTVLARVLVLSANLQENRGENTGPAADSKTARELYLMAGHKSRAANVLYTGLFYTSRKDDYGYHLGVLEKVLQELLEARDFHNTVSHLGNIQYLFFTLANSPEGARVGDLVKRTVAAIPPGKDREKAELASALFLLETGTESEELAPSLSKLTKSSDREIRCLAHQRLAMLYGGRGEREQALQELRKALELSSWQMRQDPEWPVAPGPILLRMSYQEKARHNNEEAIRLGREGIRAQGGEDWRHWRVQSRYDVLMAAMESYNRRIASEELEAGLLEIERLPTVSARVGFRTRILSSLLVNQSVEADVLDPAELLLGEYPESTRELIDDTFQGRHGVDDYLAEFDQWHRSLVERGETSLEGFPLVYKGLFLEALGRTKEAEGVLVAALRLAEEHKVKASQMLSRILLARIYLAQDRPQEAVEKITEAARVAETLNPLAARFYLLVAGSAQRRYGSPSESLETYSRAAACQPEKAWPAYYGRALALEKLGRPDDALAELDRAMGQLGSSERLHSIAEVKAARARLLATL